MRVLKTMNTVGEIKREDVLGMTMDTQQHQHQRSGNMMKKVLMKIVLVVVLNCV